MATNARADLDSLRAPLIAWYLYLQASLLLSTTSYSHIEREINTGIHCNSLAKEREATMQTLDHQGLMLTNSFLPVLLRSTHDMATMKNGDSGE